MLKQAEPGWYRDYANASLERWWDGSAWTGATRPKTESTTTPSPTSVYEPAVATQAMPSRRDDSLVWILALVPLLFLGADLLFPEADGVWVGVTLLLILLNITLATLDSKSLKKRGIEVSSGWAWLLVPVYLILRTRAAASTAAIPVVWFITFAVSLAPVLLYYSSVWEFNASHRSEIRSWVSEQGVENFDLDCPTRSVSPGDVVDCTVTDGAGDSARIEVTILDGEGYEWNWAY